MKKTSLLQSALVVGIGLGTLSGYSSLPQSQTPAVLTQTPSKSLQQLPTVPRIKLGRIQYIQSEKTPDLALERAIRQHLDGYTYCNGEETSQKVRYFYNHVDLNDDRRPETIVYLVGSYTCGTGGCNTFIFRSSQSGYQLISKISIVNNPIVVSSLKTKGWRDLVLYVAGGGASGRYHLLRFNGKAYPSNPSVQPLLKSGSTLTGQALISDRISFDTAAPALPSENCQTKTTNLLKMESLGGLKIGLTMREVFQQLGSPETKGKKEIWGADGLAHQTWFYAKQGITLDMVSATVEEQQKVAAITLKFPTKLKTKRGIGIGSSSAQVMKAYEKEYNLDESLSQKRLVVRLVNQDLIFSFQDGYVVEIFLGSSAE